ncbi:MAG TPA: hypothetical protein VK610_01915 [Rhodothermales bacterium]|nr:hypothetical protein [Rhodothermales bacterium]
MPAAVEPRRARPGTDPARAGAPPVPRRKAAAVVAPAKGATVKGASAKLAPTAPRKKAAAVAPAPAPRKKVVAKPTKPATHTAATREARRRAAHVPTPRVPTSRRLPTWSDLDGGADVPMARRAPGVLDSVPSLRLAAWTLVAAALATLYVGHVYATRTTLAELQQARRENMRLHLTHERLRGSYDHMTGPSFVLDRASALGLEEGAAYAPPIRLGAVPEGE